MTFSIAFHDRDTESWGVGVASKFLSVGSVVPWAEEGTGAIATQAYANYTYGPRGLQLLASRTAQEVVNLLTSADEGRDSRQLGIVDSKGRAAAFTGSKCMDFAGHIVGDGYTVQGNILAGRDVIESMAREMESGAPIAERVIRALEAADSNGGDKRGRQGAAILIASSSHEFEEGSGIMMNLRVDDHEDPIGELRRMSLLWDATFFEQDMVSIADHQEEITEALNQSGYDSLKNWAGNNNFGDSVTETEIGEKVLQALVKGARKQW